MKEKVGLMATARKKSDIPQPVVDFYKSPLFKKSLSYARMHYDRFYFYNAKDGFLLPNQIMEPYDVSIKTFSAREKRNWAKKVITGLAQYESPENAVIYLHGGFVYRKYLQPELQKHGFEFIVPLKGMGIGEQLAWYDQQLKNENHE